MTNLSQHIRSDETLARQRPRNFPEMVRQLELGIPIYVVNGNFLDEFYHAKTEERQSFLDYEPQKSNVHEADLCFYAHCAAVAEKLAHDYELDVPKWVDKPEFILNEPDYGGFDSRVVDSTLVAVLQSETPIEFAKHNLFTTSNVLVRY
jgi:hypothetical protein